MPLDSPGRMSTRLSVAEVADVERCREPMPNVPRNRQGCDR
jgi:hypothetical protein